MTAMPKNNRDKPVQPLRSPKPRRPFFRSDRMLAVAGVALAAGAAAFPWYVFFNEEKFGISVAGWEQMRDVQGARRPDAINGIALDMRNGDNRNLTVPPVPGVDGLMTATVSKLGTEEDGGLSQTEQPFPGKGGFRLLHVSNGRAMIEDNSGMYMVQVGSTLPDNSRLAALQQQDGKWVIVTSTGAVYPGQ